MKCVNHPDVDVSGYCSNCGRPFCNQCLTVSNNKNYCKNCIDSLISQSESTYSSSRLFQQQSQNYSPKTSFDMQKHFLVVLSFIFFFIGIGCLLSYKSGFDEYWIYALIGVILLIISFFSAYYYMKEEKKNGKL
jgi:NADH:ubiquinone oxidoreductase subunit 3 (subunit A)